MKLWYTRNGHQIVQVLTGRSRVFLVCHKDIKVLVDTSIGHAWTILKKRLNALQVDHIDYLILTHSHFDHAANAHRIIEKFNVKVIAHKSAVSLLEQGKNEPIHGTNSLIRPIVNTFAPVFMRYLNFKPCKVDIQVDEYYRMDEPDLDIQIMHTPGHTEGSVSIIVDDEIALVGDTMFGVFKGSVFPPFAYNIEEMIRSWGKLLETPCRFFLPAHGTANERQLVEKEYLRRKKSMLL